MFSLPIHNKAFFFTVLHVSHPGPLSLHLNDRRFFLSVGMKEYNDGTHGVEDCYLQVRLCQIYKNDSAYFEGRSCNSGLHSHKWQLEDTDVLNSAHLLWWRALKTICPNSQQLMERKGCLSVIQATNKENPSTQFKPPYIASQCTADYHDGKHLNKCS